jgi:hypothetical protein
MSCNIRESLLRCTDKILETRENIGAQLADAYIITRTWSGERPGDGSFSDVESKIYPTPEIKDYSHDVRVQEAGAYKSGDLVLVGISRNQYPEEEPLRTDTTERNVEKFIKVGTHYYRTIHIKEKLVTWDLHIRKVAQDETERG